ncbi:gliding motility lipoprotein GldD [Gramella sp. GC03-9]|uniref:Gliding motility lipoprotein GldD n=1 Tax=Christiangramia oceanisediminis TaxID=2920386 RepID=A0A9X2I759_9FLAO|nr:gliding motility lipoprotein GldD [Gramella oceanisediminis]MCP9198924.1 gliding motility lipoprotein GldD [Gramella oceanisediminis]
MRILKFVLFVMVLVSAGCKDDPRPKPKAFLALEYPKPSYERIDIGCPYVFEKNELAKVLPSRNQIPCWITLDYEFMKGSIFITYQPVRDNLDSLLMDAQKLPLQHTIKADLIEGDIYTNDFNQTYGMFYEIEGDAASQAQFYLTDSTDHFITGSVYFDRVPNFDSIVPAADYLKKDIRHLMESLKWKEE